MQVEDDAQADDRVLLCAVQEALGVRREASGAGARVIQSARAGGVARARAACGVLGCAW